MITPKLIAYSKDLVIIPFRNVIAVDGDITETRETIPKKIPTITIYLQGRATQIFLSNDDADLFLELYNLYLRSLENGTIKTVMDQESKGNLI